MRDWFMKLLEVTGMAVVIYLVIQDKGTAFSNILGSGGNAYATSVAALQGNYKVGK